MQDTWTRRQTDQINADFAEHVCGWMAVGKRKKTDSEVWQGVPSRDDILRDIPLYWYRLEDAMEGIYALNEYDITLSRYEGRWACVISSPAQNATRAIREESDTPSQAIVRCLLRFVGHEEHLPPRDEPEGA
jgi:hypothetical protein